MRDDHHREPLGTRLKYIFFRSEHDLGSLHNNPSLVLDKYRIITNELQKGCFVNTLSVFYEIQASRLFTEYWRRTSRAKYLFKASFHFIS